MPLQNRVTPFGEIVALPARGAWMGNRGRLHDANKRLTRRRWTTRAWITCKLHFRERRREVMAPGRYTELFFLDEATAFAAGHRPCAECRRADFLRFRDLFARAKRPYVRDPSLSADEIDRILHKERRVPVAERPRIPLFDSGLPDGTIVALGPDFLDVCLVYRRSLYRWSAAGYDWIGASSGHEVVVLTPPSIVETFSCGYMPQVDIGRDRRGADRAGEII